MTTRIRYDRPKYAALIEEYEIKRTVYDDRGNMEGTDGQTKARLLLFDSKSERDRVR